MATFRFQKFPVKNGKKRDQRYEISREFCGYAQRQYVLRFCEEWIVSSPLYSAVQIRANKHNQERLSFAVKEAGQSSIFSWCCGQCDGSGISQSASNLELEICPVCDGTGAKK